MVKILIINNGFRIGGIEIASVSFANYCSNKGYEVAIAAIYPSKHEIIIDKKVTIFEPSYKTSKLKCINIFQAYRYIRRTVRKLDPDVVVAHGEWTNGFVAFALIGLRKKLFLQDHMNPDIIPRLNFLHKTINKLFYHRAEGIIALSNYSKDMIKKYYKVSNVAVIPNPVRELQIESGKQGNHVVTIGRMSKEKGHIYLVKAWKKLKLKDWVLDIVGDGPEFERVKKESEGTPSIVFHGFQKDITSYLSEASIFVLPSLSECFPLALIEAMSVGKACVATDCMSGKDTIVENEKNGLLVQTGNADMIAEALQRLIADESLRLRLGKSAAKIKTDLSPDKLYGQYLDFIGVK